MSGTQHRSARPSAVAWLATAMFACWLAGTACAQDAPVLVKDVHPGTDDAPVIHDLVGVGGRLFFVADDGVHGEELWASDGTAAGTAMVRDIHPTMGSEPRGLRAAGDVLYFVANDGSAGFELWRSDGTAGGTVMVRDINAGGDSYPAALGGLGGLVLFSADDGTRRALWRSDGTQDGTVRVADVGAFSGPYGQKNTAVLNGMLFFAGAQSGSGIELWRTDGSTAGTARVKDINPGSGSSDPEHLRVVGNRVVFRATDGSTGVELWRSDGTEAGTVLLKDINPTDDSRPRFFADAPGIVFFAASDGTWVGLWRSDGTREGTVKITDVALERAGASEAFTFPAWANGRLFFGGWDGSAVGLELWTSDGTPGGTGLLKDINPTGDSYPTWPVPVGDAVYFYANDGGTFGGELWRSDGTPAGTVLAANLNPDGGSYPADLTNVGGTLFFTAYDGVRGQALWALVDCGNGAVGPGEQCDDRNRAGGDCCAASCTFESGACDDGDACTTGEQCSAGVCTGGAPVSCDDGDACTTGERCDAGACIPGAPVACAPCELCDPSTGCVAEPRAGCRRVMRPKAALTLTAGTGSAPDRLLWAWRRGEGTSTADFGDPAATDDYALCLYDTPAGAWRLLLRARAPAGGTCGKRPCWRRARAGFRYRDAAGTPDGLTAIDLHAGGPGAASIVVSGRGANFLMPALPVAPPFTAQVQAANGGCWEASYPAESVRKNTATRLRATGR